MILNVFRKFVPSFLIDWYHFLLPALSAFLYRFPSKKMIVIGVTGTSGKSTVVNLTTKILTEAGYKVASLSSIKFKIGQKIWPNTLKMTMPGRLELQKFLRKALDANCQYVVLEVTSEGIKQHRHRFIDFDAAVFTNLTPEHIEAHGSFEKYRDAKGKLFNTLNKKNSVSIINIDDSNTEYFLKFPVDRKYKYGFKEIITPNSRLSVSNCLSGSNGISFEVNNIKFNLCLLGEFNIYNSLAAICVGLSQGINVKTCRSALEKIRKIPGRMEIVVENPFKVFVDYAITPNALEKVYQVIQKSKVKSQKSKVICVLGACGGGRDKWKRPVLGELAAKYCNQVIVTNEDPYDEDPMEIIEQIVKGTGGKAKKILDRRKAIRKALKIAKPGDVVVITGKGCESWICIKNGKKIPWDDREVVRKEFENLNL
ncbi:UDP-N-acetylmuramoyl-L-alanyl-D-glutamate--2,6-diaminopimelate ligase [Patescibacteria group bacterium]|nr:UDP-N-acetylmuramoyl-L-alanyl-D-glutamate--2,6-diaminopimelate ligase [Patescibacteria group bacterium]